VVGALGKHAKHGKPGGRVGCRQHRRASRGARRHGEARASAAPGAHERPQKLTASKGRWSMTVSQQCVSVSYRSRSW
jgi:hypothetical protein